MKQSLNNSNYSNESSFLDYYNNFYKSLSKLDEKGNTFKKIKSMLPELRGKEKIIDIGCGHGGVCHYLIDQGYDVTGIEINDDAIKSLQEKGYNVLKKDITKGFDIYEKYDLVLILDVLEHVFDPVFLISEAIKITAKNGSIIISVPLYFDLLDRLKILFTGSVISMDNLCYGKENYKKFKSYNYDHIRFFRPSEMLEIGDKLGLKLAKIEYKKPVYYGESRFLSLLHRLIFNKYFVSFNPSLFAHSMKIRWQLT